MPTTVADIRSQLIRDEGFELKPYRDTGGLLHIGVGRNLEHNGISSKEAMMMLDNDLAYIDEQLERLWPWTRELDEARRGVLQNMAFNLGIQGLANFRRMLEAVKLRAWHTAAEEMRQSVWAVQVGDRSERLVKQMEEGAWV